jgi:transposase
VSRFRLRNHLFALGGAFSIGGTAFPTLSAICATKSRYHNLDIKLWAPYPGGMARRQISNELWAALESLILVFTPSTKDGRRRTVDDRAALNGILYVLQMGIPWEDLPQELGFGSAMTCWRRLRDWHAADVWSRLHLAMLRRLREHDKIDWERASLDAASVSSPRGARKLAPTQRIAASSGRNGT